MYACIRKHRKASMSALKKVPNMEAFVGLLPKREEPKKGLKFEAWFGTAGNFTFVLIVKGTDKFIGVSKRNPDDNDALDTGLQIAAVRAYRSMCGYPDIDAGYSRQRPVSKREAKFDSVVAFLDKQQL
jgi:hypothetical protein